MKQVPVLEFLSRLRWIDGRPLLSVIEPYGRRILSEIVDTADHDGRPRYNQAHKTEGSGLATKRKAGLRCYVFNTHLC